MIGDSDIQEHKQTLAKRFQNFEQYESVINTFHMDYDADDTIFTGYIYKLNAPEFNKVKRSEYGKRTDFEQDIVQNIGINCFIPTSGYCFTKSNIYLTDKDSKQILRFYPR